MIIKRVLKIGGSRAITLPREFPHADYVTVKLEGEKLIIKPLEEAG